MVDFQNDFVTGVRVCVRVCACVCLRSFSCLYFIGSWNVIEDLALSLSLFLCLFLTGVRVCVRVCARA